MSSRPSSATPWAVSAEPSSTSSIQRPHTAFQRFALVEDDSEEALSRRSGSQEEWDEMDEAAQRHVEDSLAEDEELRQLSRDKKVMTRNRDGAVRPFRPVICAPAARSALRTPSSTPDAREVALALKHDGPNACMGAGSPCLGAAVCVARARAAQGAGPGDWVSHPARG
jgi:hypothetical protein